MWTNISIYFHFVFDLKPINKTENYFSFKKWLCSLLYYIFEYIYNWMVNEYGLKSGRRAGDFFLSFLFFLYSIFIFIISLPFLYIFDHFTTAFPFFLYIHVYEEEEEIFFIVFHGCLWLRSKCKNPIKKIWLMGKTFLAWALGGAWLF